MTRTTNLSLSLEPSVSRQPWLIFNELVNWLDANLILPAITNVSTTYAVLATDYTVNCTSGTFTVTLPTAVGADGQIYNIKNSGTGVITLATTSAQTIDGNATATLTLTQYENLQVQSNGANWIIL